MIDWNARIPDGLNFAVGAFGVGAAIAVIVLTIGMVTALHKHGFCLAYCSVTNIVEPARERKDRD